MIAIVNGKLSESCKNILFNYVDKLFEINEYPYIKTSVGLHPDIHFTYFNNILFYNPYFENIAKGIEKYGIKTEKGASIPEEPYPYDIGYNILKSDKYKLVLHNFRYTDSVLYDYIKNSEYRLINISQGYSNCSSFFLDNYLITSDYGIINKLSDYDIDIVYVDNKDIKLDGFKFGFIGGVVGVYKKTVFFNGNLDKYNDGQKIFDIINKLGYSYVFIADNSLEDVGSFIFI